MAERNTTGEPLGKADRIRADSRGCAHVGLIRVATVSCTVVAFSLHRLRSKQPGVAGSSHESLKEIEDSARFFLSNDLKQTRAILHKNNVAWVFTYDSQRVTQNSAAVLSEAVPADPLCRVLDRTPGQAPPLLIFSAQTPACKLYRVSIER